MAQLSISAAARAVGKDRGTIHRYIKSGRLSTSKNIDGSTAIETAELLRVFGVIKSDGHKDAVAHAVSASAENSSVQQVLETTLELLKQQLTTSQEREERLLAMLEQEQQSRRDLERRLLPPGPATEAEKSTLEGNVSLPSAHIEAREEKKGFFAKLFGG